ncbi:MAG TPA: ATP-binding protein [Gemmatimonadaceae bacterium]|nr:ATP-binding protein [Gemmatimonadaceae bacterium]
MSETGRWRRWAAPGWWVAVTLAVLAASAWLRTPTVQYLALGSAATAAAAILIARRARRSSWMWTVVVGLALTHLIAIPAQVDLWRIATRWEDWQRVAGDRALAAMTRALDGAIIEAQSAVNAALRAPSQRRQAFEALAGLTAGPYDRGVVLRENATPFAWSGNVRLPLSGATPGVRLAASSLYLELRVMRAEGARNAVAVVLLDAASPGDSLARPLARVITLREVVQHIYVTPAVAAAPGPGERRYLVDGQPLLDIGYRLPSQGEVTARRGERARINVSAILALSLFALIIAVWRESRALGPRLLVLGLGLVCTAIVPVSQYSNASRLFDPTAYFASLGSQLTANAGALSLTSALALLGVIAIVRTRRRAPSRLWTTVGVTLIAGLGPFLLRELARGIQIPFRGVDSALWLMWEIPLFLAGVVVLLAGASAGGVVVGRTRGLHPALAPVLASFAAIIGPVVWQAPGQWPWWYTFLWIGAIASLALSRQTRNLIIAASTVAALGSVTLVWGRSARGRVALAEADLKGLAAVNQAAAPLLQRFAAQLAIDDAPPNRAELLKSYVSSDLAAAQFPVTLTAWSPNDERRAAFQTSTQLAIPSDSLRALIAEARRGNAAVIRTIPSDFATLTVLAAPGADGGVTTVGVAPRSRLFAADPYARLLGLEMRESAEPPYTIQLRDRVPVSTADTIARWRRDQPGSELHGDWAFSTGTNAWRTHVEVELRALDVLIQRGTLIVILDLAIVAVLWAVGVVADGRAGRWLRVRRRRWWRSYRARLSLALFAFFIIPAAAFAAWSYRQLANDARQARQLLVTETLRAASPDSASPDWLRIEGRRLGTPLLLYVDGELRAASDTLLEMMAPFGRLLDPVVHEALSENDEGTASRMQSLGPGEEVLVGYRPVDASRPAILAAPARADELSLDRRRRDLGVLVLFATALGGLAALWLSGIAARQLARPIRNLREAALSIGGGERLPSLEAQPTVEFQPVFSAFRRMATDLHASRSALEDAQRRTIAVLRNVASGVVAVDDAGVVTLANPRAETLLGHALPPGTRLAAVAPALSPLIARISADGDEEAVDLEIEGTQLQGRTTRLGRGGAVITLDDVTELARAQRVLAWGEMARQVAHEIKNPLTPIRLGVQHLKRARSDARVDFDKVLDDNVARILGEIDRLDEIARAFSRYGSVPAERSPAEAIDVPAIVRDVVGLEQMGSGDDVTWSVTGADRPTFALARRDELKEVLLNVLENARHAHARNVTIALTEDADSLLLRISDDGDGIPADVLPRVFEPHFSTRTSGSGLGLAISRQIIDGWGGEIGIESTPGKGTVVMVKLRSAEADPSLRSG